MSCVLLILMPVSYHLNLSAFDTASGSLSAHDSIALSSRFHLGFFDGGVWFFSHDVPYMGSIMWIGGPGSHEVSKGWYRGGYGFDQTSFIGKEGDAVDIKTGCDLPGVYFRHFQLHRYVGPTWTLMLSLWYPISLLAVLPALWMFRHRHLLLRKRFG